MPRVGYRLALPAPAAAEPAAVIPSLAVLPFANLGGDPEQDWFSDGIVDDMITALSRFRSFAVVARTSSFVYKGRAADVRQVARELGVRYVLEGSVRRAGDRLRITAQLVDGGTGAHLWAEHFDGALGDVFAFQDRITADVAMIVGPQIQMAEIERSRRERPGSIAAYDAYLQAVPLINKQTARENADAYALLTARPGARAGQRAPARARRLGARAPLRHGLAADRAGRRRAPASTLARRALQHAAGDPTVLAHCGLNLLQTGREYDWGMADPRVRGEGQPQPPAGGHRRRHRAPALRQPRRRARLLPPRDPALARTTRGARLADRHRPRARRRSATMPRRSPGPAARSRSTPTFDPTYWMLVAANAHLGRMDEARRHLAELRRLAPEVTVASIRAGQCAKDPGRIEPILAGLRLAGLPEG